MAGEVEQNHTAAGQGNQPKRLRVRWDTEMGCYRVNVPEWDGGEVVPAEVHDAEVARLREALKAARMAVVEMLGCGFDSERRSVATEAFDAISTALDAR